jgi:hypothetical protein
MRISGKAVGLALAAAFIAFLLWSTLSSQTARCEVCVEFNGRRNCAVATAASADEAARSAQATACGILTKGMDESIACSRRPPDSQQCSSP